VSNKKTQSAPAVRLPASLRTLLAALVAAGLGAAAVAQEAPPRDARNASFWQRIDHPPADALEPARAWIQPVAPVRGAPGAFLPAAAAGHTTLPARALDEASQFAEATQSQALIVIHRGVVQLERYYGSTRAATQLDAHGLAATLATLTLGTLIADGSIPSLDEPASTWLTEWRDGPRAAITLRQLLTHSAGLHTPASNDPASHALQQRYGADIEATVRAAPLATAPGTQAAFDDDDDLLALGLVIERASGKPYPDAVSQRVWQGLGAADTQLMLDRAGGHAYPAAGAWTLALDWARVGQMLLAGGRWQGRQLVPAAFVDAMRQPSAANPHVGLQVLLGAAWLDPQVNPALAAQGESLARKAPSDLYYLSGAAGQLVAILPSEQLVVVRLGKASPSWRDQALPLILADALRPGSTDWSWLYDWRLRIPAVTDRGLASTLDATSPGYWPAGRVAGAPAARPLARRESACLTPERMAPAVAEVERVRSASFVVWRDGAIEFEWYGAGYDAHTRAESTWMHTTVLGLLIGQAVADGRIPSLDAPVSRWLTEWAGDPRGAITVRQMLRMASGLQPLRFDLKAGSDYSLALYGADSTAITLRTPLVDAPGSRFNYASGVAQLLGVLLQRATGTPYADYLSRRLWQPIGASDAFVALDHPGGGMARVSSSLMAIPEDWVRLGLLFVDHGKAASGRQVVAASWMDEMAAASPINPNYGMLVWRANPYVAERLYNTGNPGGMKAARPFLSDDMLIFDGAGAQRVYASAHDRLVIVRLGAPTFGWDDSYVPNIVTAAARACR
jgi:CubicO group peptidase (beta-lactamase class C family)